MLRLDDRSQIRNRLLCAMAPQDFDRLRQCLEPVLLTPRQVLSASGAPIEHVYFPQAGMVSTVMPLADGEMTEVGLIGREGFVGAPALLGSDSAPTEALAQTPGAALRLRAGVLREEAHRSQPLRRLLLRYVYALHAQACQSAVCNAHHLVNERLARWLLMARDRWDRDELPLNHEFIAMMLGVRRPSVTIAIGVLKQAGLIGTEHGRITILDRQSLEAASCECYGAVRDQHDRVFS